MTSPERLTDEELAEIEELAQAATPGPWFVRNLDDDHAIPRLIAEIRRLRRQLHRTAGQAEQGTEAQ